MKNSILKFSRPMVIIHWLTFIAMLLLIGTGFTYADQSMFLIVPKILFHSALGLVVFLLTVLRIYYIKKQPQPTALDTGSTLKNKVQSIVHKLFYVVLILLSFTGVVSMLILILRNYIFDGNSPLGNSFSPQFLPPPFVIHRILAYSTILLLVIHVSGLLMHGIKSKLNPLRRMS